MIAHPVVRNVEQWWAAWSTHVWSRQWLSGPRHCSVGVQPVLRAVYYSGSLVKHSGPQCDSLHSLEKFRNSKSNNAINVPADLVCADR